MTDILRMESFHVLAWIDCVDHALRVDVLRQWQLHQNPIHSVIGIEPGDQRQQLASVIVAGKSAKITAPRQAYTVSAADFGRWRF